MNKDGRKLLGEVLAGPTARPKDLRGSSLETSDFARALKKHGVLILEFRDESRVESALASMDLVQLQQYELVKQGLESTRMEVLARTTGGVSSAGIDRHTLVHQDAYQYASDYKGQAIAGRDRMPLVEVLGYSRVVEERWLSFYDLGAALVRLASLGESYVETLTKPLFDIDPKYRTDDPDIRDLGPLPLLYGDAGRARFRLGGSVVPITSKANTALTLFNDEVQSSKTLTIRLQPDLLFVVMQGRIGHRGIRTIGRDGLTVLTRTLWGKEDGVEFH